MTTHEFSHLVTATNVGPEGFNTRFEADERARQLLAKRFGIVSVDHLSGTATLTRESDGMTIHVSGAMDAQVTQACVTTLDPVKDRVQESFEGWFLDESQAMSFTRAKKRKEEEEIGGFFIPGETDENPLIEEREEPEPVVNGMVDVGELVAQFLSLALNPYPHSEKALAEGPLGDPAAPEKPNPFEALKDWKAK